MKVEEMFRHAARIEHQLRAKGVPSVEIPGILGGAFMASLTNLADDERRQALMAHLIGVLELLNTLRDAPQAPDGPMPELGKLWRH